MGFLYKAPVNFTGAFASGLPLVDPVLPVPGAVRWFDAAAVQASPGATITSWEDSSGSGSAMLAATGKPTLELVDGLRAVRFRSAIMQQNVQLNQPHTVALAFKLLTVPSSNATVAGSFVNAGSDTGLIQVNAVGGFYANGGTSWNFATAAQVDAGWHRVLVSFEGGASRALHNGRTGTGNTGTLPRAMFSLGGMRGAGFTDIAVTQAILFPRALSSADMLSLDTWLGGQVGQ